MGIGYSIFEAAAVEYCRAYEINNDVSKQAAARLLDKISCEYTVDDFTVFLQHVNNIAESRPIVPYTAQDVTFRLKNDMAFRASFITALHLDKRAMATLASGITNEKKK